MNYALQVFDVREAFVAEYSVPRDDVLSESGGNEFPPAKPILSAIEPGKIVLVPASDVLGYRLYRQDGSSKSLVATVVGSNLSEISPVDPFFQPAIRTPGLYSLVAYNGAGDSDESNVLELRYPGPDLIYTSGGQTRFVFDRFPPVFAGVSFEMTVSLLTQSSSFTWSVVGTLPPGISLDPVTGVFSGVGGIPPSPVTNYPILLRCSYDGGLFERSITSWVARSDISP